MPRWRPRLVSERLVFSPWTVDPNHPPCSTLCMSLDSFQTLSLSVTSVLSRLFSMWWVRGLCWGRGLRAQRSPSPGRPLPGVQAMTMRHGTRPHVTGGHSAQRVSGVASGSSPGGTGVCRTSSMQVTSSEAQNYLSITLGIPLIGGAGRGQGWQEHWPQPGHVW